MRHWLLIGLAVVIGFLVWTLAQAPGTREPTRPRRVLTATSQVGDCPAQPRRLPHNPVSPGARAALRAVPRLYHGLDTRGAIAVTAGRASRDNARGGQVQHDCGRKVRNRTVIVYVEFPRMRPSASLSQGVMFVSRDSNGWTAWGVAH